MPLLASAYWRYDDGDNDGTQDDCSAQTRTGIGHLRKPPGVELIPCRRKPLRRTRTLRDPAQTQVWSEQVWLNTTFILQGSRSWSKLAVKT
jgi:hypothetical protein